MGPSYVAAGRSFSSDRDQAVGVATSPGNCDGPVVRVDFGCGADVQDGPAALDVVLSGREPRVAVIGAALALESHVGLSRSTITGAYR